MSSIYYCTKEDNYCSKKEECRRYIEEDECRVTLFKEACTEDNNYVLFMKIEQKEDNL